MRNSIKSREKQNRATKNHLSEKPARRICCEKKKKKAFLENAVSELVKDAENFLQKQEMQRNMEKIKLLLSKSNSFRKIITEKQGKMKECKEKIKELIKQKEKIVWDLVS